MEEPHDGNKDGFLDMPEKTQYNVMNRWAYKDDTWFLQFGGKFIDEERNGGQTTHGGHAQVDETTGCIKLESTPSLRGFPEVRLLDAPVREYEYGDSGELFR